MKKFKVVFKELRDDLVIEADNYFQSVCGEPIAEYEFFSETNEEPPIRNIISTVNAKSVLYIIEI